MEKPVSIPSNEPSIRELLEATLRDPANRLGEGKDAVVFQFAPGLGLDEYVVRVTADSFKHVLFKKDPVTNRFELDTGALDRFLTSTTALHPVRHAIDLHLGQPLMQMGDAITIHRKQHGRSMLSWYEAYKEEAKQAGEAEPAAKKHAAKELMQKLVALKADSGVNPFIALFEQLYQIQMAGSRADTGHGNILIDEDQKTLKWVDQVSANLFTTPPEFVEKDRRPFPYTTDDRWWNVSHSITMMDLSIRTLGLTMLGAPDDPELLPLRSELLSQIAEAKGQLQLAHKKETAPEPLQFHKVEGVQAVAMTDKTSALVRELSKMVLQSGRQATRI